MTYVLHYAPDNASLIVRLALEHLRVPYVARLVDRSRGAQRDPVYLALNPNGLIPVLETTQGPLFETGAILLWLVDRHDGLGPGPDHPARGNFLKWLFFTANTLHPALRMLFHPETCVGSADAAQAALRRGLQAQIKTALRHLDAQAATDPGWFGGARPGALDFYVATCLRWCALYPADAPRGWFALSDTPHLAQLCARLETQPCTAAAQAAEGLGPTPFTAPKYPHPPQGSTP